MGMAFRIVEADGVVEFDTLEELAAYKQWKAQRIKTHRISPASIEEEPKPAEKVIVLPQKRARKSRSEINAFASKVLLMRQSGKTYPEIMRDTGLCVNSIRRIIADNAWERIDSAKSQEPATKVVVVNEHRKWHDMKNKPYLQEEIEQVRNEYQKRGKFQEDDFRIVGNKMRISRYRVQGIYYKHLGEWQKPTIEKVELRSPITPQEIEVVTGWLKTAEHTPTGKLRWGAIRRFAEEHGMTENRVSWIGQLVKQSGMVGEEAIKTKRHRFIWQRIKALQAQDPRADITTLHNRAAREWDGETLGKVSPNGGTKQQKVTVKDSDLEFPTIYPLEEGAVRVFEQMMIDLIAKKHGKIDYYLASATLQLREGHQWDYQTWMEFCKQVLANSKRMAKALVGCDASKIRLEKGGGSLVIKYG
jgi:hypothetical protein